MVKKKVLVVDDSESTLFLVKLIFENDPCLDIILESDSTKVLSDIEIINPDLLLLDVLMPKLDGIEVLKELHKEDRKLPVIITSALSDSDTLQTVKRLGALDYVRKPIEPKVLTAKVKKVLT